MFRDESVVSRPYKPESNYQLMSHVAVILVLLILLVSAGYYFVVARPDEFAARDAMAEAFELASTQWEERKPASYRYVVDRNCDCPPEIDRAYVVTVSEGARDASFPIPVEASTGAILEAPVDPVWLEDVIDNIERVLRSGGEVDATYNYLYGYPERVDLAPGDAVTETARQFEIRDFEVIRNDED